MNLRRIIIIIVVIVLPMLLFAQDRSDLVRAERNYQTGLIKEALNDLQSKEREFKESKDRQSMYRLMALCYLALDSTRQTEYYASLLLKENPNYTSMQDPIRFEELIDRLRSGRTVTITTASNQSESLAEAPVPVTIITKEMIEMLGYNKNLAQILTTFVPGMTEIASNKLDNVAMHGAYTMSQEKILVMENGHRLNARSTNLGQLDYAISTEKIDHIEVLRGPASSLYGNVALTAVVNIITKSGENVNGVSGRCGFGSYNTYRADLLAGMGLMNGEVSFWGSIYKSDGQEVLEPKNGGMTNSPWDGNAYVNKYRDRPSYDVGLSLKINDFSFYFSRKYGQKATQYSQYSNTYSYEPYRQLYGSKPSYGVEGIHTEASYQKNLSGFKVNATLQADWYTINDYMVASDEQEEYQLDEKGNPITDLPKIIYKGIYSDLNWRERTIGGTLRIDRDYTLGKMRGNLMLGVQFENFHLYSTDNIIGINFEEVMQTFSQSENPIMTGMENSLSFFIQDKHRLSNKLIVNAGLRYDKKYRVDHANVNAYSPRVALVYMPSNLFSMKMSYSHSFVDAPYFYRRNNDTGYLGASDLTPELMDSYQLDFVGNLKKYNLSYDVNFFYNCISDMVIKIDGSITDVKFKNSGLLKTVGAEGELHYNTNRLMANLTLCYTHPVEAQNIDYCKNNRIHAVPTFTGNLQTSWKFFQRPRHGIWLTGNVKYRNSMLISASSISGANRQDYELSRKVIFDLGARYQFNNLLQLTFDCENLFDTTYYSCGTTYIPEYMMGRMLMSSLKVTL